MLKRSIFGASIALALMLMGGLVGAETNSYFDKEYEYATLKTFDYKMQRRISVDPVANNSLWGDDILTANVVPRSRTIACGGTTFAVRSRPSCRQKASSV